MYIVSSLSCGHCYILSCQRSLTRTMNLMNGFPRILRATLRINLPLMKVSAFFQNGVLFNCFASGPCCLFPARKPFLSTESYNTETGPLVDFEQDAPSKLV